MTLGGAATPQPAGGWEGVVSRTPQHHSGSSGAHTMIEGAGKCKISISTEGQPTNAPRPRPGRGRGAGGAGEAGCWPLAAVRGSDCRGQQCEGAEQDGLSPRGERGNQRTYKFRSTVSLVFGLALLISIRSLRQQLSCLGGQGRLEMAVDLNPLLSVSIPWLRGPSFSPGDTSSFCYDKHSWPVVILNIM